jgi:hypothetical protein
MANTVIILVLTFKIHNACSWPQRGSSHYLLYSHYFELGTENVQENENVDNNEGNVLELQSGGRLFLSFLGFP